VSLKKGCTQVCIHVLKEVLVSLKKGCTQVCIHIDHNRVMLKCINTTNIENTQHI